MESAIVYEGCVVPRGLRYSERHSWVQHAGGKRVRVGVTDYVVKKLRAVVYVEPPRVGARAEPGDVLATLESVEAVAEVYAPLGGWVAAYNEALDDDPLLLVRDPYGRGWVAELEVDEIGRLAELLPAEAYVERVLKRARRGD